MKTRVFSAPGRVEISGNHTDHQHGLVLTAAVDLDIKCSAVPNEKNIVNINSERYPAFSVDLNDLSVREDERETSASLVRGVAAWFTKRGLPIGGFDGTVTSTVPAGSGLSSSAAFEVLIGNVFKGLYGADISPLDIAVAGKYAENEYFGKPCGLMDQAASSCGGFNMIDFSDPNNAVVTPVDADLAEYAMCVVETGDSHADLTAKYAAIPQEMKTVSERFSKDYLNDVNPDEFYAKLGELRKHDISDRAILRAIHFFEENKRVQKQAKALQCGDIETFLSLVIESGRSSLGYLQNVINISEDNKQGLTLAFALSEKLLKGTGAWRNNGGGFAGTILAFVPDGLKADYKEQMSRVFGGNCCHFLSVRKQGGMEILL